MHKTDRRRESVRFAVSWVLAVALGLSGWPTPALQALAQTADATDEEAVQTQVDEASTLEAEEATPSETVAPEEEQATDATEQPAADDTEQTTEADEAAQTEGEQQEKGTEAAVASDEQQAESGAEAAPADEVEVEAPNADNPSAPQKAGDGDDNNSPENPDNGGGGEPYVPTYDETYPYDAFIDGGLKDAPIKNLYDDSTYTINFDVKAIENSEVHGVQPDSIPGDDTHCVRIDMGTMYTVKEATEDTPAECAYKNGAHWFDWGNSSSGWSADNTSNAAFTKTYDRKTGKGSVAINTAWLYENYYKDHPDEQLHVEIWICMPDRDHSGIYSHAHPYHPTGESFWIRGARVDYRPMESRTMLRGWQDFIDRNGEAWIENSSHPWGENVSYEVTGVELVSGANCFELDEQDNGWNFRAVNYGTATFRVSLETDEGVQDSYEFTRTVAQASCDVDLWVDGESGSTMTLPGGTISLTGRGRQHREDAEDSFEGFTYAWEILNGIDAANLLVTENADGSSTAMVMFANYEESGFYSQDVTVRVTATKDGESASHDIRLIASNDYPEIWINETNSCTIDPAALIIGASMQVTPEVRRFTQGQAGYTICDLRALSWGFDENCVKIKADDGTEVHSNQKVAPGTYTITRIGDWGTNISLTADWADPDSASGDDDDLLHEHADWWLFDCHVDAWLDDGGNCDVFSDGTTSLWVRTAGAIEDPYKLYVNVGPWDKNPGEDGFDWSQAFAEGDAYTYNRQTGEIVVNGAWLSDHGYDHVQIFTAVTYEPNDQEGMVVGGGDGRWINVREASTNLEREWDRDLLPGWDGSINADYNVRVEDSAHPDGWDGRYTVTNVEVVSGSECLSEFHRDQNENDASDYWWYYRAGSSLGTATLKVTYQLPEELGGGTDSYTFKLNVSGDVYDVDITATPACDNVLPGSTVDVYAQGYHHRAVKHDDDDGYDFTDTTEGMSYRWELEEGADIATMTVDSKNPGHITLTIADMPAGQDRMEGFVLARVYLYDDASNSNQPVTRSGWAFDVRSDFVETYPTSINRKLDVSASETVDLKLVHSVFGKGDTTIDDAQFYFWYDPNCVRITDAAGKEVTSNNGLAGNDEVSYPAGTYTITRLGDWGTGINVRAVWSEARGAVEEPERREYWRNWQLDGLDYNIRFDAGEYPTSTDCAAVAKLDVSGISGIANYEDHLRVQIGCLWDGYTGAFVNQLSADEYTLTKGKDVWTITIPGSVINEKMIDWSCWALDIHATFDLQDYGILRDSWALAKLVSEPTHALTRVAAKAATLSATGNKQHWRCEHCGKLFADAEGATETTKAQVTIAKLINISGATITVAAKPYTGKALTFTPVVKLGGKTLKAGTNYTVSGNKQTKPGTYTLAIKGAGLYGGSKTAKFTVSKAAQNISAVNRSVEMGKTVKLAAANKTTGGGKLTYKSSNTKVAKVSTTGVITPVKVGKVTITITAAAKGYYRATTKKVTVTVVKGAQPMTITGKTAKVDVSALKKANQKLAVTKVLTVSNAQGKVTYKKVSGNAKITITSTGAASIQRGLGKGKYTVKVKVLAAGNANYKIGIKTVTFTIMVK